MGVCWSTGNVPYFNLNGVNLAVDMYKNALSCTLTLYALYCICTISIERYTKMEASKLTCANIAEAMSGMSGERDRHI